ncbi:MAG: VWA domain-containing protein [Clostridia bacterium]|nr:VWA domain-containing protein [Clostridia bacterium]
MNYFKTHKVIAFFLAILMILPLIPAVDLTVFAEGTMAVTTESLQDDIGKIAKINPNPDADVFSAYQSPAFSDNQQTALRGRDYSADVEFVIIDVYVSDSEIEDIRAVFYKVAVIGGTTVPDFIIEYPWIKQRYLWEEDSTYFPLVIEEKDDILKDATTVGRTGYFVKSTIRLYNTSFEVYEYRATSTEVYVAYSFTYNDEWYYWLGGYDFDGGSFCIVKAEDVSFIFDSIINTKVIIKPSVTSVNVYADPKTDISTYLPLDAALFDGVYKVTDTYYSVSENILFYGLAPCERMIWPEETEGYRYVSSEIVEETDKGIAFPIVDFCNPAPIMGYTSQIQPRSAIYGARSAIAQPSIFSANSLLSTAAEGTSSSDALKLSKDVRNNGDGTYTITLEAYTTGTVTVKQTTKPMDIVLVLDQSGSMAYCIGCGNELSYHDVDDEDVVTTGIYYRKKSGIMSSSYVRLYYCSQCDGWHESQTCSGYKYTKNNTNFYEACSRRYDALITALNSFVTAVKEKTVDSNGNTINHRIAIVGFSSDNFNNTELLTGVTINAANRINDNNAKYYPRDNKAYNGVQYGSITPAQYQAALQDMSTTAGQTSVEEAIKALTAHGGTETLDGLDMAYQILSNDIKKTEDREKVVILFTDGATNSTRSAVLNKAYDIKDDFSATVYSVGIFDGANGNLNSYTGDITNNNSLMHVISSNYPTANYRNGSVQNDDVDDRNPLLTGDNSYYLSASDATALNNIFKEMSSQIGGTLLPLDSTTVVKDIITPQFTLPANANAVQVYSEKCKAYNEQTGTPTWGGGVEFLDSDDAVTIDTVNHCVDVTGFDFAHNYVAQNGRVEGDDTKEGDFHGRRLVIVFTITPDPDFLGGDGVATNGTQSGIYSKGEPIAFFPPGSVSVPLKGIENAAQDMHVYYGNVTDLTGILNLSVRESDSQKKLQDIANGINNAYVELKYYVTLEDTTVYTYTIDAGKLWNQGVWESAPGNPVDLGNLDIRADKTYSVYCIMTSVNNLANTSYSNKDENGNTIPNATAWIYVYKPTLTFEDSEQKYKAVLNRTIESHLKSTEWIAVSINKRSTEVTMEGQAPTLNLTYTPNIENAFANNMMNSVRDVPVNVTVTINGTGPDIPGNEGVTFAHATCSHPDCAFNPATEEFIVHVVGALTSLKIQKVTKNKNGASVSFENIDPNQTFLFRVMGKDADGQDIDVTVTVHAKDGFTIVDGLVIGNQYTVQELTDWSWRYTCELGAYTNSDGTNTSNSFVGNTATLTITALGELNNVATFENTRNTEYWLDGDSWCDNRFMANVTQAIN